MTEATPLPRIWKTEPYDHQRAQLLEHWERKHWAIFGEMGTGKTWIALNTADYLQAAGYIDGLVVIAPNGVYRNWLGEIEKHMPNSERLTICAWDKSKSKRAAQTLESARDATDLGVLLINIEALRTDRGHTAVANHLDARRCLLVVDESTVAKNHVAKQTKALHKLARKASHVRIMSGTPITQNPLDLWAQAEILCRGLLGDSFYGYKTRYAEWKRVKYGETGKPHDELVGFRNLEELQKRVARWSTRTLKSECLDLPEKVYERYEVELTSEQHAAYRSMQVRNRFQIGEGEVKGAIALTKLMRLQQIVCGFVKMESGEIASLKSNRIRSLLEILETTQGKVIIWCPFRAALHAITMALVDEYGPDAVVTYHGGTPESIREHAKETFQNPDLPVHYFVGNPQTAGYGLTLTAAHTVIYFGNSYKLEERLQSEDRCHRIGQTNAVTYIDMVAPGTVDVKVVNALRAKLDIASEVMGEEVRKWI